MIFPRIYRLFALIASHGLLLVSFLSNGVTAQDCTLCANDTQPANPDWMIPYFAPPGAANPTCQEIFDTIAPLATTAEQCSIIQSHANYCGCPETANEPINECPFCPNVGDMPQVDETFTTPSGNDCSFLDFYMSFIPADQCDTRRIQALVSNDLICECPGAEVDNNSCSICPDGTNNIDNSDSIIPLFELPSQVNPTCEDLRQFLINQSGDATTNCDIITEQGGYCGCEGVEPVNACTFCPNGEVPSNGDLITPALDKCEDLNTYISFFDEELCNSGLLERARSFNFFCGCPDVSEPACSLCMEDETLDASALAFEDGTLCQEFGDIVSTFTEDLCQDGSVTFARTRCCIPEEPFMPCSVCPDGTSIISNIDWLIPSFSIDNNTNPSCEDLVELANMTAPDDEVCSTIQAHANYCGCEAFQGGIQINQCSLCPEVGQVPEDNDFTISSGESCDFLNFYLTYIPADYCESERISMLKSHDFLCGCPNSNTSCPVCPDGTSNISNVEQVIPFLDLPTSDTSTCGEMRSFAGLMDLDEMQCDKVKLHAGFCGCPGIEPLNVCTFCPNGESPSNLDAVTPTGDKCEDLDNYFTFLDEEGCNSDVSEAIRSLGYFCGCPGAQPACTLCPEDADPVEIGKEALDSGETCGEMADIISIETLSMCEMNSELFSIARYRCCEPNDDADIPMCSQQQNPDKCTTQLLSTTDAECECFSFCDGEFVECSSFPGDILGPERCMGTRVTGCNWAIAIDATTEPTASPTTPSSASPSPTDASGTDDSAATRIAVSLSNVIVNILSLVVACGVYVIL